MRTRVLIVDDSLFMRAAIKRLLERDARFEVVGEAKDGREAVERVADLRPDVCTMDFNMPNLDGAEAVREIMRTRPTPVVMLSAHTREGARETFAALDAGAVDFVTKPSGEVSAQLVAISVELTEKLIAASEATLPVATAPPMPKRVTMPPLSTGPRTVLVAVSTGGPAALGRLFAGLPEDAPLGLIVIQHLPAGFTAPLAERLDGASHFRVREAQEGDRPGVGLALVAPGDRHLELRSDGRLRVFDGPEVNGVRPSADVTMLSAAKVLGRRAVGVVMTGMGRDGADGIRAIKQAGGATLVQDQASSVIYGMPRAALETGCVDRVVALDRIAETLARL